jgi:uncharacterized protein YtpQ (UPF0354 family)
MGLYNKATDEQVIQSALDYMEKYPNASRYNVIKNTIGNEKRIRDLEKLGLVKLPKPLPKGGVWGKYFYIQSRDKEFVR